MEKEKILKEEDVLKGWEEKQETAIATISDFSAMSKRTNTKSNIFTNITDKKKLFNLDSHVDELLNECENELIRVKEIVIKRFEKPLKNPVIDEETGEVLKEIEVTMSCILIDDNGKSYATGSKMFTIQMMRYLEMFGIDDKGFEIKIVKRKMDTGNKSLAFELV